MGNASLVSKLHSGTLLDPREVALRADSSAVAAVYDRRAAEPPSFILGGHRPPLQRSALLLALVLLCFSNFIARSEPSSALQSLTFHGGHYLVRTVDPQKEDLRLYWRDDHGSLLKDFTGLEKLTTAQGDKLLFAANAGMFEPDRRPVGLLVQNGNETSPLNLNDAPGNFYMKPNGAFLINAKHEARVIESSEYPMLLTPTVWATQSGPLLVHGGSIHPDFIEGSKNLQIRSGVGVREDGSIVFALSREPVNFYDFAALFLYHLKCPNALFLDGHISAFYAPGSKDPTPHIFGPMIGIVEKAD